MTRFTPVLLINFGLKKKNIFVHVLLNAEI